MKKVVHLRVFKGTKILKDENGKVENENNKVSLTYESLEWKNYLKRLVANGFCKVEVEKLFELVDGKYVPCEIPSKIKEEVLIAHKGDQTVRLTPEQQKIADLEAKLEAFMNLGKQEVVENIKLTKEDVFTGEKDDLEELKAKYKEQEKKDVPNNKKNDKEWIKSKLTK